MTVMPLADEFDAEEPVIEAIRGGDRYAFQELMQRQGRWVRGVVFGILGRPDLVDDVCQQIWTAVWQRVGELRDVRSWRSWLYRLAHNLAIDAGRDSTRRRTHVRGAAANVSDAVRDATADRAMIGEERQRVMAAVQGLPAIYREPFVLRHLNDWSYRQIADVMGLPVDSVETRLVRARRLLRDALAPGGNNDHVPC
jgi:RNA polymerase sigma-70 factor (ECF subfamily)